MTTPTRYSPKKGAADRLPAELQGIDRVFGRDLRSQGWAVDLTRMHDHMDHRAYSANRADESLDPAMIWVMRGRRR